MPNWCEGYLRVRGTKKNVVRLFTETLKEVTLDPKTWETTEEAPEIRETEWSTIISLKDKERNYTFYMKDSRRHFIEAKEIEIYYDDAEDEDEIIFVTKMKGAWGIETEYIRKLSEMFNVDIKVDAYELGMGFSQHMEFHKGKVIREDCTEFRGDLVWKWDCECPDFGG